MFSPDSYSHEQRTTERVPVGRSHRCRASQGDPAHPACICQMNPDIHTSVAGWIFDQTKMIEHEQ